MSAKDSIANKQIPVTVITGFLGAGKTTLLHHVLNHKHGKRIAVLENELAHSIGLTNELHGADQKAACVAEVFETTNGCICCGSRDEFISTLYELIRMKDRIDYLIIETTGRSDPTFVQIFEVDNFVKKNLYVDGIITLVDAQNVLTHLAKDRVTWTEDLHVLNEAQEQIAVGDRIVINKTDLVSADDLREIESEIRKLNPYAQLIPTQYSKVDVSQVLDVKAYDIKRILKQDEGFLEFRPYRTHSEDVEAFSFEGIGSVDLEEFRTWMNSYLQKHDVLRAKGVLNITGKKERYIFQSVRTMLDITPFSEWGNEAPVSKLAFIGMMLDEKAIVETFPTSMKLEDVISSSFFDFLRRLSHRTPKVPRTQFVLLGLALLFFKGGDLLQYVKENPIATAVCAILMLAIYFYFKMPAGTAKPKKE